MQMKKAIITGANGFVGSALAKTLLGQGISVTAIDVSGERLPKEAEYICCDIAEIDQAGVGIQASEDAVFYHLAWRGSAGAERGDYIVQTENIRNAVKCLYTAKDIGCTRFVFAGTIMEHESYYAAFDQKNKAGTGYIYGASKYLAHTACKAIAADLGIDFIWAGLTNAYGAGELSVRLINATLRKVINNEPLEFTSGTQNYDFVYIDDAAMAFYHIGKYGKPFCEYIIGSGDAKPLREFLLEIKASVAVNKEFRFGDVAFTGVNMPLSVFDCSMTKNDTGFEAKIPFTMGIRQTMDWLIRHEE